MRNFAAKSVELMTYLAKDPSLYIAERMAKLESRENPELLALFEAAGAGDQQAAIEAQKIIVEEELGGCESLFWMDGCGSIRSRAATARFSD